MLYMYESSLPALLCRILQLSIPSLEAAKMMSLFGTVVEVGVRILFYNLYVKAGIGINKKGGQAKADYLTRVKLRGDGPAPNDMMLSSTLSAKNKKNE